MNEKEEIILTINLKKLISNGLKNFGTVHDLFDLCMLKTVLYHILGGSGKVVWWLRKDSKET